MMAWFLVLCGVIFAAIIVIVLAAFLVVAPFSIVEKPYKEKTTYRAKKRASGFLARFLGEPKEK